MMHTNITVATQYLACITTTAMHELLTQNISICCNRSIKKSLNVHIYTAFYNVFACEYTCVYIDECLSNKKIKKEKWRSTHANEKLLLLDARAMCLMIKSCSFRLGGEYLHWVCACVYTICKAIHIFYANLKHARNQNSNKWTFR